MVYLLNIVIFHGYVSHNQMVAIEHGHRNSWFTHYIIAWWFSSSLCKRLPEGIQKHLLGLKSFHFPVLNLGTCFGDCIQIIWLGNHTSTNGPGWWWLEPWNFEWLSHHIGNGMSSSQLTKSIILQRGRYTTNQLYTIILQNDSKQDSDGWSCHHSIEIWGVGLGSSAHRNAKRRPGLLADHHRPVASHGMCCLGYFKRNVAMYA